MESQKHIYPVPEQTVAAGLAVGLALVYSAPTPGAGSRYVDGAIAHETRMLAVIPVREVLVRAGHLSVGEALLEATVASSRLAGFADVRGAGYLAPLARAALLGEPSSRVLSGLGHGEIAPVLRSLEVSRTDGPLAGALRVALEAGKAATLWDAMRYASARDSMAREYARDFEVTRQLARPALLATLSRAESARAAVVQCYLEVLSEVPDLDVAARAGQKEAGEVSRMARGVLKAGGVHSRRGLQAIANLDGLLRENPRLAPTATEPPAVAASFLIALEYGPESLSHRIRPATGW